MLKRILSVLLCAALLLLLALPARQDASMSAR